MRTVPTIIIIVVLLLGGSWTTYQYIENTTLALKTQLESVDQSICTQKWEAAQKELTIARQGWDNNKTWWTLLLDHQEIDNIDMSMNLLEKYLETQNLSLSLGEISTLKFQVDNISDSEKLNLQNIL